MKTIEMAIITTLLACSQKQPTFIQGYIYNEYKNPIEGAKVEDPNNENISSITNNKGYFKINQMISGRYLYLIIKEKKIDSIYIVRTHPERGMSYSFVESRNDTVFVDMKKHKISSQ